MLCLKYDVGTRLCRSFLGLNVPHGDGTGVHTRTLAVREIKTTVRRAELSKLIGSIFRDQFDISMSQITSITTDNSSTALAGGKFINADMFRELESFKRGKR